MKPNKVTVCFNPSVFEVHTKAQGNTLSAMKTGQCVYTDLFCVFFFLFLFFKTAESFPEKKNQTTPPGGNSDPILNY